MRKNPYLKQEQEFRPLLIRGSFGNNFLTASEQPRQELTQIWGSSKETYTLNNVNFDMIRPPSLNTNGTVRNNSNIQMCSTECTQELFEEVMGFDYSYFKYLPNSAKRPAECVTWFDCIFFCNKLSEMLGYAPYYDIIAIRNENRNNLKANYPESIMSAEVNIIGGHGFRLPTVMDWLFFAKTGTNNTWSGTSNRGELGDYAWYWENSYGETHLVATKKPNEWGMYDMSGNVWEWCWDEWSRDEWDVPDSSSPRFKYGGGYDTHALNLPLPNKNGREYPNERDSNLGFRFARTIE